MTNQSTTTTQPAPATPKQLALIADLSVELDRVLPTPASSRMCRVVIAKALGELAERDGDRPRPTRKQLALLERLGAERGRSYKTPATRRQATARIRQILGSGAPKTAG